MEFLIFLVLAFAGAAFFLRRSRVRTSRDEDAYVHGTERFMPEDDLATRRAGTWPGPGGPIAGSGGGNVGADG